MSGGGAGTAEVSSVVRGNRRRVCVARIHQVSSDNAQQASWMPTTWLGNVQCVSKPKPFKPAPSCPITLCVVSLPTSRKLFLNPSAFWEHSPEGRGIFRICCRRRYRAGLHALFVLSGRLVVIRQKELWVKNQKTTNQQTTDSAYSSVIVILGFLRNVFSKLTQAWKTFIFLELDRKLTIWHKTRITET